MIDDPVKDIAMPPLPPEEPVVEEQPQVEAAVEPEPQKAEEQHDTDVQQRNFRAIRDAKERAERERDAAYQRLQEFERMQQMQAPAETTPSLADDDLVEWKHVKNTIKNIEQKLNTYQQTSYEQAVDAKIKFEYPDFDKVVSSENINALRDAYPELAGSVSSNPDLYGKAVSAYKLIKQFGIDTFAKDRETTQKNAAKPRPLVSASPQQGETPLSRANIFADGGNLTDTLKKQLREEMEAARRAY